MLVYNVVSSRRHKNFFATRKMVMNSREIWQTNCLLICIGANLKSFGTTQPEHSRISFYFCHERVLVQIVLRERARPFRGDAKIIEFTSDQVSER